MDEVENATVAKCEHTIEDKKISTAIMSPYIVLTAQLFILNYFAIANTTVGYNIQFISKIIVGIMHIVALPIVLKRNKKIFIHFFLLTLIIFLLNFLIFERNRPFLLNIVFPLFFTCLPSFIYAYSIYDRSVMMGIMKSSSKIVLLFGVITSGAVILGKLSVGTYNMSLSYYMLLPALIYLNEIFKKRSVKNIIYFVVSLSIIISLGSRGAIMCIIVFIVVKLLKSFSIISVNKLITLCFLIGLVIVISAYAQMLLKTLNDVLNSIGLQSRTLSMILQGSYDLSGREKLYELVIKGALNSPLFGLGLAGDRHILKGSYAHNIFIELISNFGFIVGISAILFLSFLVFKSLVEKETESFDVYIVWICLGFVHLFVSSSYLIDFRFWIFLGICARSIERKRFKKVGIS